MWDRFQRGLIYNLGMNGSILSGYDVRINFLFVKCRFDEDTGQFAVSYTHLTLPTTPYV